MASVKLETRNEGRGLREWDYVPLSEPRVVMQQVRNRWKVDQAYLPLQYESGNPLVSNGVFPFSEPVLVSYMDLDMLIEAAPLAKSERKVLAWTMRGHSLDDIGERYGCAASTVLTKLKSAVLKICALNDRRWIECNRKSFGIL